MAAPARAAVITVTTLFDNDTSGDGFCTLREAIKSSNQTLPFSVDCVQGAGLDTIEFAVTGTILLNDALPEIDESAVIQGPGANLLTIDGVGSYAILSFDSGAANQTLTVRALRLLRGSALNGGAVTVATGENVTLEDVNIQQSSANSGGAVYGRGAGLIKLVRCGLRRNEATIGGGVYVSEGELVIEDSTLYLNKATGNQGGAVYANTAEVTLRRSTFSANTSVADGGGLAGVLVSGAITSSTFTLNQAGTDANGGDGGGIWLSVQSGLTMKNVIVANNFDLAAGNLHPDVSLDATSTVTSPGFNLIGNNEGSSSVFTAPGTAGTPNLNSDWVGEPSALLSPQLGPLASNGGAVQTHLPLTGSVAIDGGSCASAARDQRGYYNLATGLRPVDTAGVTNLAADACDVGSIEVGAVPAP